MSSETEDSKTSDGAADSPPKRARPAVLDKLANVLSLKNWGEPTEHALSTVDRKAIVDCGWGRLLFGQTFSVDDDIAQELLREAPGRRDVAFYIRDPQVTVARAPQDLFIDPSLTYRLELDEPIEPIAIEGIEIRPFAGGWDEYHMQRIYQARGMATLRENFTEDLLEREELVVLIAWDTAAGQAVGCVTGVDHVASFHDPDNGCSLWALAVDPQCRQPGIGRGLVLALAALFQQRERSFMDLSVMHDNTQAIALYEQLGFRQVPVYCIKNRNAINEPLYVGPRKEDSLNPYAQIIVDEAHRRGISVQVDDVEAGLFTLSLGGRVVHCRESLTDATSAVAMSRCDDKALTKRLLDAAGLKTPAQTVLNSEEDALGFLEKFGRIVVKPARGEQGVGVSPDLSEPEEVTRAFKAAVALGGTVLGEEFVTGVDLRIIVINDEVVAAATRRPASVIGNGRHTIAELISKQSRRRAAATNGESSIPIDDETLRCVRAAGLDLETVLEAGRELTVRKTANLHTGGTIHDVTAMLNPRLAEDARKAARALDIPVVGLDFIVPDPTSDDYRIIEANERPGLANHEPQPTAQRLLDFLFPITAEHRGHGA